MIMPRYCEKCGAEIGEGDDYCPQCGASTRSEVPSTRRSRSSRREDDLCFGEETGRDPLDALSFGFFLVIVGIIFYTQGNLFWDFIGWVESMGDAGDLIRPPTVLLNGAYTFFGLLGLSNFLSVAIRYVVDRNRRRIMGDLFSGIALVSFAYAINMYSEGRLSFTGIFGVEAIVVGLLVIIYFLTRKMF